MGVAPDMGDSPPSGKSSTKFSRKSLNFFFVCWTLTSVPHMVRCGSTPPAPSLVLTATLPVEVWSPAYVGNRMQNTKKSYIIHKQYCDGIKYIVCVLLISNLSLIECSCKQPHNLTSYISTNNHLLTSRPGLFWAVYLPPPNELHGRARQCQAHNTEYTEYFLGIRGPWVQGAPHSLTHSSVTL